MKKGIFCVVLAGAMALGMTACGEDPALNDPNAGVGADGKVTIQFFGWGDTAEQENYQTLCNQFMEENEDIIVVYDAENASTYMTTLKNRANNLPDLFYMPDYDFLEWVANGTLMDMSPYLTDEEISQIWPEAIGEYYFDTNTMKLGKSADAGIYGLPKDLGPFTLVYNKTLLDAKIEQYGLDSNAIYAQLSATDPMTWSEFTALLKQVDPDGGADNVYGISHYELEAAVYSNDADFFNEGAVTQTITDPNFYDAVQFIVDLTTEHNVMPSADDQVSTNGYQRFKGQGCIFSFMGPWDCAEFWKTVNFDYDVVPVPYNGANPNAQSTAWVGSMGYCMPSKIKNQTKKVEAAIKLAKYLCMNEDAQRKFYELGQQVPNLITMATGEYVNDTQNILGEKNPPSRSVWVDTINGTSATDKIGGKVRARYYTYSSDWYNALTEHFGNVDMWDGAVSAKTACEGFATTFQAYLDTYQADLG